MSMPFDAGDAIETEGTNEGPRPQDADETTEATVDEDNVPHPGEVNEGAGTDDA